MAESVLPEDARVLCFHGKPDPHEVGDDFVSEHWRLDEERPVSQPEPELVEESEQKTDIKAPAKKSFFIWWAIIALGIVLALVL